ncbi:DNA damage-induced apoptosis suppressor protein [Biomphalaria pfeifferi]|uniref:DNA damage-induced apoptosis suppressor protein n=1 Tax=Biomphalaria pfeifferi TaxID=112525 RepID=A0AAD8AV64_BIOPF|nr:DNA damage-induced apoptosis suppressor protein [Biomphalaria pfeifferi]
MSLGDPLLLAATVTDVHDGLFVYQACKFCYIKLSDTSYNNTFVCKKCSCRFGTEDTYYRYCLRLTAADNSCLANITVFGSLLDKFFGVSGSEFYLSHVSKLKSKYGSIADSILKIAIETVFVGQNLIFGFKIPKLLFSRKDKNQEILLEDICQSDRAERSCQVALPELTAVQLLPQTNSIISLTVVESLENLSKRVDEMGYLQLNDVNCEIIRSICRQNNAYSAENSLQFKSGDCSFTVTPYCSQETLRLSCDVSLSMIADGKLPDHTPLAKNNTDIRFSPVVEMKPANPEMKEKSNNFKNVLNINSKCLSIKRNNSVDNKCLSTKRSNCIESKCTKKEYPFDTKCSKSLVSSVAPKSLKTSFSQPNSLSSKSKNKNEPLITNITVRSQNSQLRSADNFQKSPRALKNKSLHLLNKENVNQSKGSNSSWCVLKYNKNKEKNMKQSDMQPKLKGQLSLKTKKEPPSSLLTHEQSHPEVAKGTILNCQSSLLFDSQHNLADRNRLTRSCDLKEDGLAPQSSVSLASSSKDAYDLEHMPESEDLELFLAALNSEAMPDVDLVTQKYDEKYISQTFTNNLKEVDYKCALNVANDMSNDRLSSSNDEMATQNQSFSMTDEYASAISFNVTLRRSQKRKHDSQILQSFNTTDYVLPTEPPESEDVWQFLERFPTSLNNSQSISQNNHFERFPTSLNNSLNISKNNQNTYLDDRHNVVNKEILLSATVDKHSEDLFIESPRINWTQVIDKNCSFKTMLHISSTQLNQESRNFVGEELNTKNRHKSSSAEKSSDDSSKFLKSSNETKSQATSTDLDHLNCNESCDTKSLHESKNLNGLLMGQNTNIVNESLLTDVQDLIDNSQFSAINSLTDYSVLSTAETESILSDFLMNKTEELDPSKEMPDLNTKKFSLKKVRFSSIRRESYFCNSDLVQTTVIPVAYKPLKSCLKIQRVSLETCNDHVTGDLSTSPVASQDLFTQNSDLVSRSSWTSIPSCNDSADLFSPCSTPNDSVCKLPLTPGSCNQFNVSQGQSDDRSIAVDRNDYSLELFSQSPIFINNNSVYIAPAHEACSTPIYMNNNCVSRIPAQDCMTPDLFD